MPSTGSRWKNRKKAKTGSKVKTDMANSAPQSDLPVAWSPRPHRGAYRERDPFEAPGHDEVFLVRNSARPRAS